MSGDGTGPDDDVTDDTPTGSSGDDNPGRSGLAPLVVSVGQLLPAFIRRKYLLKFGLALVLVVFVISVVGVVALSEATATLDAQVAEQLETDADREAQRITDWREERALWMNDRSRIYSGNSLDDPIQTSSLLQDDSDAFPDDVYAVHQINLTSTEIVASTRTLDHGVVLAETGAPWADDLNDRLSGSNDVLISDVYLVDGRPVVAFVSEIPRTRNAGLVALVQPQTFIEQVPPEEGQFVTVVNTETGEIAMANRMENGSFVGDRIIGQQYGSPESIAAISAASDPTYLGVAPNQEALDEQYVAATAPVDGTNLVVVTHAQESRVFAVRQAIVSQLVLLVGVSLVGLALIGLVIAGGTVRSINRLAGKVRELERGNLDIELETQRIDEIGQLYDGFDSMRRSLQQRIEELSEAMETEERMRKELAETNEDLNEQRIIISVLNRLLRHNLRNSLTSVMLRTQQLSDDVPPAQKQDVEEILNVSQRLMRRVEKSKAVEKIIATELDELATVDLSAIVCDVVQMHREEWPEATIHTDIDEEAFIQGGDGVSFVVDNLVENAIEHNDTTTPEVWVTVRTTAGEQTTWVELDVADDGPGIPEMEIGVLQGGPETPLEHGSGIGLWLVNWLVENMHGELRFEDRDPTGTRITARFPQADDPDETSMPAQHTAD